MNSFNSDLLQVFPDAEKRVLLLKPRGFCAGVVRAIDIVRIALETFGAPIYVRKEIVHNRFVVNELAEKGAIFVDDIDDVPAGMRVIYSAHGVSPAVRERSKERQLKVIDATCPLVTKVHVEAVKFAKQGYSLVLIGHRDHDEIEGTLGEAPNVTQVVSNVEEVQSLVVPDPERVAYLTQTTLSLDEARDIITALKQRFPKIAGPHSQDICYATENRQVAVKNVAHEADLVLVVGSDNSSNSNRLVEVSRNLSTRSHLIENSGSIRPEWLEGVKTVVLTAGASAPEVLVEDVVNYLRLKGFGSVEEVEVMPENVRFGLPPEIVQAIASASAIAAVEGSVRPRGKTGKKGSVIDNVSVLQGNEKSAAGKLGIKAGVRESTGPATPRFGRMDAPLDEVAGAVGRAREYLLGQQHPDGYWCGELEADAMLEADYIFGHILLGTGDAGKLQRALNEIFRYQKEDGGWSIYPGGPSNISLSVKCYLAGKLLGSLPDEPAMARAREWILAHGGVVECNTFTKIYLCSIGQYDYDAVPAIPPEIVLFPNWFYFNIYEISSWSRSILVPLSILYAKKPFKKLAPEQGIDELFVGGRENADLHLRFDRRKLVSWRNFFLATDRLIHLAERVHIRPLRRSALKRAEKWMLERLEMSDGLGAIYPAMLNSIIALRHLGYSLDDPQVIRAMDEFEKLGIDEPLGTPEYSVPTFRMQPAMSPVWDTAQAVFALGEADVPRNDPRLLKAVDWMLSKEVRHKGDWAVKVRNAEPGGWAFEHNNEFYPDVDDSGQVLLALNKVDNPRERYQYDVSKRAIEWIFAMQCRNGGWASFDKDNTKMIFQYIPFADHNAMLDPPTVDITGRILETLATYGYTQRDKRVEKAIKFIYDQQEPDGSWFGRWGVNYLYGTFLVLRGLEAIGVWNHEPQIQQAAEWIRMVQNSDGGWGESLASYDNPGLRGIGESTPSQTAWALLGLLAAGDTRSDSVAKGTRWLLTHQRVDGSWDESVGAGEDKQATYTGTGFPRVFYLAYHLYRQYFPLLALTTYRKAMERGA